MLVTLVGKVCWSTERWRDWTGNRRSVFGGTTPTWACKSLGRCCTCPNLVLFSLPVPVRPWRCVILTMSGEGCRLCSCLCTSCPVVMFGNTTHGPPYSVKAKHSPWGDVPCRKGALSWNCLLPSRPAYPPTMAAYGDPYELLRSARMIDRRSSSSSNNNNNNNNNNNQTGYPTVW